jgi:hypothetical protein
MPILSTEKEEHGRIDARHCAREIQTEKFRRHRAERCVNATMDGHQFPGRHQPGEHTPNDQAHLARLPVKDRAIPICEALHRQLPVTGFMGRRPDFPQACQDGCIPSPRGFGGDEIVLRSLCLEQGNQWGGTDERGHFPGMMLQIEQSERCSPGVTDENDPVSTEKLPEMIDDSVQIREVTRDGQQMWIGLRIERAPGTPLIPIRDDEAILELAVEMAEQWPLRPTRAAVQPEQDGREPVRAARQDEKSRAVHREMLGAADRTWSTGRWDDRVRAPREKNA